MSERDDAFTTDAGAPAPGADPIGSVVPPPTEIAGTDTRSAVEYRDETGPLPTREDRLDRLIALLEAQAEARVPRLSGGVAVTAQPGTPGAGPVDLSAVPTVGLSGEAEPSLNVLDWHRATDHRGRFDLASVDERIAFLYDAMKRVWDAIGVP